MASTETVLQPPDQNPPNRIPAVAPVWHTLLFVVVLLGISLLQAIPRFAARQAQLPSRIPTYILTICYEFLSGGIR